ncbi:hypothetical protein GQ600_23127 [Phytophthora cactorum]|nr:hypothetical protein GQ600_23127 [Phytophthora cactorum]
MLQSLSIQPLVPVMGGDPCNHSRPEPVADVLTSPESRKGINAVSHVYFRSTPPPSLSLCGAHPGLLVPVHIRGAEKAALTDPVNRGPRRPCAHCKRVATYMAYCWSGRACLPVVAGRHDPADGAAELVPEPADVFRRQLGAEDHPEFAAIMARFMQPRDEV